MAPQMFAKAYSMCQMGYNSRIFLLQESKTTVATKLDF